MYLKKILLYAVICLLVSFMNCFCEATQPTSGFPNEPERTLYSIALETVYGVRYITEDKVTCEGIRKSGKYCPYHPNFKHDYSSATIDKLSFEESSISPWVKLIHYDSSRVPAEIPHVCCVCEKCVVRNSYVYREELNNYRYRYEPDLTRLSVPIYKQHIAWSQTCTGKNRTTFEYLAVGCTCVNDEHYLYLQPLPSTYPTYNESLYARDE